MSSPVRMGIHCKISCSIQMEAKVVLARLFQCFIVSLPENYKLVPAARVTMKPKDNVPCTLELRRKCTEQ